MPFSKLLFLHVRRLAIKNVNWLDSCLQQPYCPVEHTLQVTSDFTSFIRESFHTCSSNYNQELVDAHAGVDGDFAAEVALELLFLHSLGRIVRQQLRQTLDSHLDCGGCGCGARRGAAEPEWRKKPRAISVFRPFRVFDHQPVLCFRGAGTAYMGRSGPGRVGLANATDPGVFLFLYF